MQIKIKYEYEKKDFSKNDMIAWLNNLGDQGWCLIHVVDQYQVGYEEEGLNTMLVGLFGRIKE